MGDAQCKAALAASNTARGNGIPVSAYRVSDSTKPRVFIQRISLIHGTEMVKASGLCHCYLG